MKIKHIRAIPKLAPIFSILLLLYLIFHTGIQNTYNRFYTVETGNFFWGVLFIFMAALQTTFKSIWVARQLKIKFYKQSPFPVLALAFGIGVLVPIPGFMDIFRIWALNKYLKLSPSESIRFTVVDRSSGLLSLLFVAIISLLVFFVLQNVKNVDVTQIYPSLIFLIGGFAVATFLIFGNFKFSYKNRFFYWVNDLISNLRQVGNTPLKISIQLSTAIATSTMWAIALFAVAPVTSVGEYFLFQSLMPLILIVNSIPIFFSGWGIRELAFIILLGNEIGATDSLTYAVYLGLMFTVSAVIICILGVILLGATYFKNKIAV